MLKRCSFDNALRVRQGRDMAVLTKAFVVFNAKIRQIGDMIIVRIYTLNMCQMNVFINT